MFKQDLKNSNHPNVDFMHGLIIVSNCIFLSFSFLFCPYTLNLTSHKTAACFALKKKTLKKNRDVSTKLKFLTKSPG